jgi:hypothetical protein
MYHQTVLIQEKWASLLVSWGGKFQVHKGTQKDSGTNLGAPLIKLVRIGGRIQACLRRQKGSLVTSPRHPSNPPFGAKPSLLSSGSGEELLCCVRVCESVSLTCNLVTKWVQSSNMWVFWKLIWSRVSPHRVSGQRPIWTLWPRDT